MQTGIELPQGRAGEIEKKGIEVPEEVFMKVQGLVLAAVFGPHGPRREGDDKVTAWLSDPEAANPETLLNVLGVKWNGALSRSVVTEYLSSIDWKSLDWDIDRTNLDLNEPGDENREQVAEHVGQIAKRLITALGGSTTLQ